MTFFQRRIAALYDLEPLHYALALAREGYGELTPYLLPLEPDTPRVDEREAAIRRFEEERREEIAALEASAPKATVGVREAWEAWWRRERP